MQKQYLDLYDTLQYSFKKPALLKQALTLGFGNYFIGYERLEFLGDRVLGLIVSDMLFHEYPSEPEGSLARRFTDLVRAETLADVAEKIDLADYLIIPKHEDSTVDRHSKTILSDVCEAVIAAMYLDGGLDAVTPFIRQYWFELMHEFKVPPVDAKTKLQEWAQGKGLPLPVYTVISMTGPDHDPVFVLQVEVKGMQPVKAQGNSKKSASQAAASALLEVIEK